jgi:hypothetical protein
MLMENNALFIKIGNVGETCLQPIKSRREIISATQQLKIGQQKASFYGANALANVCSPPVVMDEVQSARRVLGPLIFLRWGEKNERPATHSSACPIADPSVRGKKIIIIPARPTTRTKKKHKETPKK